MACRALSVSGERSGSDQRAIRGQVSHFSRSLGVRGQVSHFSAGSGVRSLISLATLQITRAPWIEKPLITRDVLSAGGGDEIVPGLLDLGQRHGAGIGFRVCRRAQGLPADQRGRRAHAGMMKLQHCVRFLRAQGAGKPGKAGDMSVVMGAKLARKALTAILNRGRARHCQAKTALRPHGEPAKFVVAEHSVGMALLVGQRGQHETLELSERNLNREQVEQIAKERLRLAAEVSQTQTKLQNLGIEKQRLEEGHQRAEKRLQAGFHQQRGAIRDREKTKLDRLEASEVNLRKREASDKAQLENTRKQGLSAAGVDTEQVETLEHSLNEIRTRLRTIAENRHEVSSWKEFSLGPLARLDAERERARQAQEALTLARASLMAAEEALGLHVKETELAIEKLGIQIRQNELNATTLQELLDLRLAAIPDLVTGHVVRPWTVDEIATEVPRRRSELTRA